MATGADERATKTTFYLRDSRRAKLKRLAAEQGRTVTDLLAEGADMVIGRYAGRLDRAELERRAAAAAERLREGLYSGPPVSDHADDVVYRDKPRSARRR